MNQPSIVQVLVEIKAALGRLEERIGALESRKTPGGSGDEPPQPSPEEEKEITRLVKLAEHDVEQRMFEAEKFAEKSLNGTLTDEEREEYMNRWTLATRR